jgi:hypothetical protein
MNKGKLNNIKNSGFKTPNNYFDGLEDSIMDQINLSEKITGTGFKTPDNYFETLEDKILVKVNHKTKVIPLFSKRNLVYVVGIAAALILMFNLIGNRNELTFDDLEMTSIENYLSEEDINAYELASLLTNDELITDNFIDSEVPSDILEEYLLQNSTIEDLITE